MSEAELPDDPVPVKIAKRARVQAGWCTRLGSPLYGELIERVADDVESGGPFAALMTDPESDPLIDVPMLRLMGAAHRLALNGSAPELARFYPSCGGTAHADGAWEALLRLARDRPELLREHISRPVQTNEIGRSAPLSGGFAAVARDTGLPLRLLEVGASAGLNLRFDHYRYETGGRAFGPPGSPVVLSGYWDAGDPPYDAEVRVVDRRGCDPHPVDPTSEEGRLTLLSYLWADQLDRVERLRGALDIARRVPVALERADGCAWVERELARASPGVASVVFHSVVMPYLSHEERERFAAAVRVAGERADTSAPVAWLRMEYGGEECELRLTLWPGGGERLLATCGFHGLHVVWLEDRTG